MDIPGFDKAQREYDQKEPDDMPEPERAYKDALGREEQVIICKEYLTYAKGWDLFDDWLQNKSNMAVDVMSGHGYDKRIHENIREYCERLQSFWDFINAEA